MYIYSGPNKVKSLVRARIENVVELEFLLLFSFLVGIRMFYKKT